MKFPWHCICGKSSDVHEPVKRSLIKKGKEEPASVIPESMAAVKDTKNEPSLRMRPVEPVEMDCPIRCPQPERGIMHDGVIFKERLKVTAKTKGELTYLMENEVQRLLQREHNLLSDRPIFPYASAPVPSISHLVE